jgi:arylsulfatase A-like enzyme
MSFSKYTFIVFFIFLSGVSGETKKPNILIIVADDMGWADVGYHGSKIKTPNIDSLCKQGIELDQHYVAPMCTPTRVSLLTGRYWSRFGNNKPSNERVLPWSTITLASALKDAGYRTAISGKWHLGSSPKWGATKFGFEASYGSLAGGVNPINHLYKTGPYSKTWHRNDKLIDEEGHVTDLIANEALRVINEKSDKPFFLYVPFTAVHTPFDEPQKWLDSADHIDEGRRQYAACAQHMDDAIGQFVKALKKNKQYENTLILFFSDNGGTNGDDSNRYPDTKKTTKVNGLNYPLRAWKKDVYEGGTRVPAFLTWPGKLKPGKILSPMSVTDWMPTLCSIVGYTPKTDLKWDGLNILSQLRSKQKLSQVRTLYCHGVASKSFSLRHGDWKLVQHKNKNPELYDITKDPYEKNNVARQYPEKMSELAKLLKVEQSKDNDALPDRKLD